MADDGVDVAEAPADRDSAWKVNKATVRILTVLSAFAAHRASYGVTELSQKLGMTKNMVFRALNTLVDQGYLVRAASGGRYELGFRVVELLNPRQPEPDLRTLAKPFLRRLAEMTGESVLLTIHRGDHVVVIDGIESSDELTSRVPIGAAFPLHVSPASRAVLGHIGDAVVTRYIKDNSPLRRVTDTTITDAKQLWQEVRLVRERGYALGYGDSTPGKVSVAFPMWDAEERVWGAVAVGGPGERFTRARLEALLPQVQGIARELNQRTRLYSAMPTPGIVG